MAETTKDESAQKGATNGEQPKKGKEPLSVSRRTLCIGVGSTVALLGLGALRYVGHNPLCRPPGGQDEARLVSACIRCERCYEVCPHKVIVPAHIEDGLLGMRSPMLSFDAGYCDFCQQANGGVPLCCEVCPTEALRLPEGATAQNTVIGLAVIDQWQCLAYRETGCRECYDACCEARETPAIELTNDASTPRPVVIAENCNGCGACEAACISLSAGSIAEGAQARAIVVKPLASL